MVNLGISVPLFRDYFIKKLSTSQTIPTVSSHTVLIYFNTFVTHMGSHIT